MAIHFNCHSLGIFLEISIYPSTHPSTHLSIHPLIHPPSIHPSTDLFIHLSTHPSMHHRFIHLCIHPSTHPPVHHPSIHLPLPSTSWAPDVGQTFCYALWGTQKWIKQYSATWCVYVDGEELDKICPSIIPVLASRGQRPWDQHRKRLWNVTVIERPLMKI